ncbi:unnamed protein product [Cyprideis torosa]|uniref:COG complex component COG2 C-terminal domain-containing protein n=1 Tax=Cyprideis torosa TaxID=163714 RepID=A0A7R8ZKT0_9CRUS|nr:unnamed protein product [Cyprideis torosa]CAG0882250.1 unnamed protein product [Cyprideis torosa]
MVVIVEKVEKLLEINPDSKEDVSKRKGDISGDLVERIASELNQIHFHLSKAEDVDFVQTLKPRIAHIGNVLKSRLEKSFMEALSNQDIEALRQCLRIHAYLDRISQLEGLFRTRVVQPYMRSKICMDDRGCEAVFKLIFDFVPERCSILEQASSSSLGLEGIQGYDFLVNAVWPEVVSILSEKCPSLYAMGSADSFFARYTSAMRFLDDFEAQCSSIDRFRAHPSYARFINEWNLELYFELRFQELCTAFEKSILVLPLSPSSGWSDGLHFAISQSLCDVLRRSWDERTVFLRPLLAEFWKLTLQVLSRMSQWLKEISEGVTIKTPERVMTKSVSTPSLSSLTSHGHTSHQSQDRGLKLNQVVYLAADLIKLEQFLMENLLVNAIVPKLQGHPESTVEVIKVEFKKAVDALIAERSSLATSVCNHLRAECGAHIRFVSDIPRLFRRTNREVPSKPSAYVAMMLKPLSDFQQDYESVLGKKRLSDWIAPAVDCLVEEYSTAISEVLTGVQKMEESLRRLKKVRDISKDKDSEGSKGPSDDDKIRKQLQLDTQVFAEEIEKMFGSEERFQAEALLRQFSAPATTETSVIFE